MEKRFIEGVGYVKEQQKEVHQNGIHLKDQVHALKTLSKWHALPPYVIDKAIENVKKGLNQCPDCGDYLHPTNIEGKAPRDSANRPISFPDGKYKCKECVGNK